MVDHSQTNELIQRFSPLWGKLRPAAAPCPFCVDKSLEPHLELQHASAGRDAVYVQLTRKWDGKSSLEFAVTVNYAPSVEGTTIIYDLLNETMQGKARPFNCDLSSQWVRPFLLLPFQEEHISMAIRTSDAERILEVTFLDASKETIQGVLPFQFRVTDSSGKPVSSQYAATSRSGQFLHKLPQSSGGVMVHSCLTGREETAQL
jgi:hypothetical protein